MILRCYVETRQVNLPRDFCYLRNLLFSIASTVKIYSEDHGLRQWRERDPEINLKA
jgi:hypothetical protein